MNMANNVRIQVWCKSGAHLDTGERVDGLLAKEVEWPVVPRVGEYVVVHDGWCSEEVIDVHHHFSNGIVSVEIRPDYSGEYAEAAKGGHQ